MSISYGHWFQSCIADAETVLGVSYRVLQDQLVTQHLGGIFPQGVTSTTLKTALDIQCGPGGWILDAVTANPLLYGVGIDINAAMVHHASMLSLAENVQATFLHMDVMEEKSALLLQNNIFEYINARFLQFQVCPLWWNVLLRECWRVLAPQGVMHLIEFERVHTNSVAVDAFFGLLAHAMVRTRRSLAVHVEENNRLFDACLTWCGFQYESRRFVTVNYQPGMEMFSVWRETFFLTFHMLQPFLIQARMTTAQDMGRLWFAIEGDMEKRDFFAQLTLSSLCVMKPAIQVLGERHTEVEVHRR